ncbi:unnamed protein product [Brassica napus]|nr:unnamed protein product [Brassica napus]
MIKALLYPGAIVNGLATNMTFPKWDDVLDLYNLTNVKEASAVPDLQRLELGLFVGLLKPGRMGMFGSLLLVWGLVKEGILKKPMNIDPTRTVYVYPTMVIAMICAFSMINYNLKKATSAAPARPVAKPLMSSSKSKLKYMTGCKDSTWMRIRLGLYPLDPYITGKKKNLKPLRIIN